MKTTRDKHVETRRPRKHNYNIGEAKEQGKVANQTRAQVLRQGVETNMTQSTVYILIFYLKQESKVEKCSTTRIDYSTRF